jgi:hypothetical protein
MQMVMGDGVAEMAVDAIHNSDCIRFPRPVPPMCCAADCSSIAVVHGVNKDLARFPLYAE